jgi:hypothetical protein
MTGSLRTARQNADRSRESRGSLEHEGEQAILTTNGISRQSFTVTGAGQTRLIADETLVDTRLGPNHRDNRAVRGPSRSLGVAGHILDPYTERKSAKRGAQEHRCAAGETRGRDVGADRVTGSDLHLQTPQRLAGSQAVSHTGVKTDHKQ